MRAHDLVKEGQVPESSDHGGLLVSSETSSPTLNTSWHGGRLMGAFGQPGTWRSEFKSCHRLQIDLL